MVLATRCWSHLHIVNQGQEDCKKNVTNFSITRAIITQLMPMDWQSKRAYDQEAR